MFYYREILAEGATPEILREEAAVVPAKPEGSALRLKGAMVEMVEFGQDIIPQMYILQGVVAAAHMAPLVQQEQADWAAVPPEQILH